MTRFVNLLITSRALNSRMQLEAIRWLLFGAAAILTSPRADGAYTIDILPPTRDINSFGEQGTLFYGQTFTAPSGNAQTLTFEMQTNAFNTGLSDTHFRVLVTTMTDNPPAGFNGQFYLKPKVVLFESENLSLGANADWTTFDIDLGGVGLVGGKTYSWLLDAQVTADGIPDARARVGAVGGTTGTSADDVYPGGQFFYSSGAFPDRQGSFAAANWVTLSPSDYRDLAFRLTFSDIPEPSTVTLAALALIACVRRRSSEK